MCMCVCVCRSACPPVGCILPLPRTEFASDLLEAVSSSKNGQTTVPTSWVFRVKRVLVYKELRAVPGTVLALNKWWLLCAQKKKTPTTTKRPS